MKMYLDYFIVHSEKIMELYLKMENISTVIFKLRSIFYIIYTKNLFQLIFIYKIIQNSHNL
jgi:hypothetical protein